MLKGDLYKVNEIRNENGICSATVELIPDCRIYKAHFPGMPITPGVCITQMCVELASEVVGRDLELAEARDIRFLATISPAEHPVLTVNFSVAEADRISAEFQVLVGETCHAKLKITLA